MPDVDWSLPLCDVLEGKEGRGTTYGETRSTHSSVVETLVVEGVDAAGRKRKAAEVNGEDNFGSQGMNIDEIVEDTDIAQQQHEVAFACVDAFFGVAYVDDGGVDRNHAAVAEDE